MSGITAHRARVLGWTILTITLIALPVGGIPRGKSKAADELLAHVSQSVALRYWSQLPQEAPARLASALATAEMSAVGPSDAPVREQRNVFNADVFGLPQNEESITACQTEPQILLGGTNDFRGLIDAEGNFTGWHFSNDGGRSLTNEGLLPTVPTISDPSRELPSGGDPVKVAGTTDAAGTAPGCQYLYAGSLAYNPVDPFGDVNGIALYRSTPEILATCPTEFPNNANPDCWPTRRLVAEAGPSHFLDKEWFDVGVSGAAGEVVWAVYADFAIDFDAPFGFTGAEIFAVRCDRDLVTCTAPIPISEDDFDVQFADVTIGLDGRVYVTWSDIICELPDDPECPPGQFPAQTFVHKLRVAEPGSVVFGPERVIHVEDRAIEFGGFLHANDFRVATYPKNEVVILGGQPRLFVVWDACAFRPLPGICEEAEIKLRYSDDLGVTWSDLQVLSRGGDNYFPAIDANDDPDEPRLAFTWFTNRFDGVFHNRQDVEFLTMDPARPGKGVRPRRITTLSNESEADPLLGGGFIGDYIEVAVVGNRAWVHFNANYLQKQLLGPFGVEGVPVAQQDNFLVRLRAD